MHTPQTSPAAAHAFEAFVNLERDLVTLLEKRLENDQQMLGAMREARP